VIIKSHNLGVGICFCHQYCRYPVAASDMCYLCASFLELGFDAL
jgi:hypothetical protein